MSLKEQEFALAAYVLGASKTRILFKHLVINCMGSIIVNVTLLVPSAIFTEAFLSFVGIGISAPAASWGTLGQRSPQPHRKLQSHPDHLADPGYLPDHAVAQLHRRWCQRCL